MSNLMIPESIDKIIGSVLGPTAQEIGEDLKKLYIKGRDLILKKAFRKIKNPNDGLKANLRVTRDVFWSGSFTDEEICAEYFGGILASSRSKDGKDDSGIFFLDIIKSLSSGQLKMHYIIYRTLNKILITNEEKRSLNPGMGSELSREKLFLPLLEIEGEIRKNMGMILHGLYGKDLIRHFKTDDYKLKDNKVLPYLVVEPTPLGVQLFAVAHNQFAHWEKFPTFDFGDFENIKLPHHYAQSLDSLLEKLGLKNK